MTPQTALAILHAASVKPHLLITAPMPPSHGDPGGWPYAVKHCPALTLDMVCNVIKVDESKCTCGADKQNFMCAEALETLRKLLP
jgi:hypothetical protein